MSRPQQPELARSAKTDLDPDHVETGLQGQPRPKSGGETGPVPPDNEPGHHPPKEQDKPDLDKFAAKLGTMEPEERKDVLKDEATPAQRPAAPAKRNALAGVAALVAVLAVIVAVVTGRRRRQH